MSRHKPVALARALRHRPTDAERALWKQLRASRTTGVRFRRQHAIGPYIVDFVCLEKRLVLEIDGGHHNEANTSRKDSERTEWLEAEGFRVLRFWNNDVLFNIDGVFMEIHESLG